MPNRREFLTTLFRAAFLTGLGVLGGAMVLRKGKPGECGFGFDCAHCGEADKCVIPHPFESRQMVWQLDPSLCTHCGQCATACVMTPSAVKCVHVYAMCGYCDLCGGYFK
ncbi:MAG TPA: 4Fe-4S binding protein, partial [Bacteroidales bacterium]|nr:4Fe-4S binding protein [Bacteroidales bacterium]